MIRALNTDLSGFCFTADRPLQGSGKSVLLHALFGDYGPPLAGFVEICGVPLLIRSPRHAIRNGLAPLTNDRKETGLLLGMGITAVFVICMVCRAQEQNSKKEPPSADFELTSRWTPSRPRER